MQNVLNSVKGTAMGVAEYLTPVLKSSRFRDTGVLTPEEFVNAGDHLVHHCPSWEWCAGDESKAKPYLPRKKQFLVTRYVACYRRYNELKYDVEEKMVENENGDGWVETHELNEDGTTAVEEKIEELTLDDSKDTDDMESAAAAGAVAPELEQPTAATNNDDNDDDDDDEEPFDMDEYLKKGFLTPETGCSASRTIPICEKEKNRDNMCETCSVLLTRTYDLHITYDKYYQTPRLWLIGYEENCRGELSPEQMLQDISCDHAGKTVTFESHPHIPGSNYMSVHPCRHAEIMKKLIQSMEESGKEMNVNRYLIVFLKFMTTIIPTIEYDFTQNVAF